MSFETDELVFVYWQEDKCYYPACVKKAQNLVYADKNAVFANIEFRDIDRRQNFEQLSYDFKEEDNKASSSNAQNSFNKTPVPIIKISMIQSGSCFSIHNPRREFRPFMACYVKQVSNTEDVKARKASEESFEFCIPQWTGGGK